MHGHKTWSDDVANEYGVWPFATDCIEHLADDVLHRGIVCRTAEQQCDMGVTKRPINGREWPANERAY
jgi:hypothetical protein